MNHYEAIEKQAKKLMHVSNLYASEPMVELAELLTSMTGYGDTKVFFCNSGTEANEAAGKLARIWAHEKFGPQKNKIIALKNSFHGRTLLSVSMTGQNKMQEKFAPIVPGVEFVELNDMAGLRKAVGNDVCALIFETIQAEGGVNIMDRRFYNEIQLLSVEFNFVRIVDEVQTGLCRTGNMFSFRRFSKRLKDSPEIITLAKALGGGLPLGAVIANEEIGKYFSAGSHGATFGGNPVACAAALAVLKTIKKDKIQENVKFLGKYFMEKLDDMSNRYPNKIKEVRGCGFMIGVQLHEGYYAAEVVTQMRNKGILVGTAGQHVVRFLPPLISEKEHVYKVSKCFENVIKNIVVKR